MPSFWAACIVGMASTLCCTQGHCRTCTDRETSYSACICRRIKLSSTYTPDSVAQCHSLEIKHAGDPEHYNCTDGRREGASSQATKCMYACRKNRSPQPRPHHLVKRGPPFEPKPTKASDTRGPSSPPPRTWQVVFFVGFRGSG